MDDAEEAADQGFAAAEEAGEKASRALDRIERFGQKLQSYRTHAGPAARAAEQRGKP